MPKNTTVLRNLITSPDQMIVAPGVYDGLSGLLAKQAGFPVLYGSGGAIARAAGYPDIGLLTMTEMTAVLANIVAVTQLPVIADADTGFGNAINVRRTLHEYERIGVAGLHIEDQTFPKRCGHLDDKSLIPEEEMVQKIKVAAASRVDHDFVLIARTDAIAVEGFDSAIRRAQAYLAAGADVIFIEAPETEAQMAQIAKMIPQPKLLNMFYGGKTPLVATEQLKAWGYKIVIIPSDLQRAAIKAIQETLQAIKKDGNSAVMADRLASFKEREVIVGTQDYFALDRY